MASPGNNRGPVTVVNIANGGRVASPTKPIPGIARPRATADLAANPEQLARLLLELDARIEELARLTAANVFGSGVLIRNIAMVAGVSQLVEHRLRRAYTGFVITRYQGVAGDYPAIPVELALPTGRSSSQWIYLQSERDCTLDVLVF